ncbi:MAG TPA: ATP-dependent zinc metalloprotease FtsH, partial [Polyangiaceae bacterium]|nr:ATP-dependent zinc metalloprotease FtsH [Polyangiaceae bacterium]
MRIWRRTFPVYASNPAEPGDTPRESDEHRSEREPSRGQPPTPPTGLGLGWQLLAVVALLASSVWLWRANAESMLRPTVDYSTFYGWLDADKVKSVTLDAPAVEGELRSPEMVRGRAVPLFRAVMPENDPALLPLLRERKVAIQVSDEAHLGAFEVILSLFPWLLLLGVFLWTSRRAEKMVTTGGPLSGFLKTKSHRYEKSTSVKVTFDDLAGLASAKRDLEEVVLFLKQPERFRRLGGKVPHGVLLVGPPGTGKTLLARAVAGQSGVPFFSISASEFIELFVGVGAARVRDLFGEAKKSAPAIIFIDELDAVGRSRGTGFGGGHDEREQTLNQLLSEMDGFARNDQVVVLAATNRPDVLDPALLRPGRFDRRVFVERPELQARRAILLVHLRNKPLADDVDLDAIARNTPGFSGADLANLVNEAALHATRRAAASIAAVDFAEAYDKIVLGDPREGKLRPDEAERVAVHEAGHTVVARFSAGAELPRRVTIIPRGLALGATQQVAAEDRHIYTEPQLASRLSVLLGGYAAERLVYGNNSTGAEHDLQEATRLATQMVAHYGMSESLGPTYY